MFTFWMLLILEELIITFISWVVFLHKREDVYLNVFYALCYISVATIVVPTIIIEFDYLIKEILEVL